MFVVLLRFGENKADAGRFMDVHKQWIAQGFQDGVFLLLGNLEPGAGGAIVAHGSTLAELRARVDDDPFVAHGVVHPEIIEITPSRADERLSFLLEGRPA